MGKSAAVKAALFFCTKKCRFTTILYAKRLLLQFKMRKLQNMNIVESLQQAISEAIGSLYQTKVASETIQIQLTSKEFAGDFTAVVFPFLKLSKKSPEATGTEIGNYLIENVAFTAQFNVIKGFLNLSLAHTVWVEALDKALKTNAYGKQPVTEQSTRVLVEYSSPNTNKPLHLGHIRNNLLGWSIAQILEAAGNKVSKVNIVNDRGIHICKSMLAHMKFNPTETPENSGKKGDHLVGEYYVLFDKAYKKQIAELTAQGLTAEEAAEKAPLIKEARELLLKWENNDPTVRKHWETMNSWVYAGFDQTYKRMGVAFDKIYYESQTYLLGKEIVLEHLQKGTLKQRPDSSVWADLTADGLDEKILLRSDGTSVYMTQDIGTAIERHHDYTFDKHIYVVGNEQDYHFKVLSLVLQRMGYDWAKNLFHMSYGMVELPEGKMKSREGTVVDADDLMDEMLATATETSLELGKLDGYTDEEKSGINNIIAMGALKYFMLKVDPKKNMTFNPSESIDFNGNTGPFIQYTYARIQSVLRKAETWTKADFPENYTSTISEEELVLLKHIYRFPELISEAAEKLSPANVANFCYDLAKDYNRFYHEHSMLKEENAAIRNFRLALSYQIAEIIKTGMQLLGIEVPERM